MKKDNEVNIGLLGLGYWGKNIFRNLAEMGVLSAACDSNAAIVRELKGKNKDIKFVAKYKEILEDKRIQAVVIATPAVTHYKLAKESLLSGKDVFVEKPLALTVKEGRRLVEIAEKKKRILMVGHILQYHPAILKLNDLIKEGLLGKIEYIYSNRLNIGKLRTEENILWSFAPHDISVILMLLGKEPEKVDAFGAQYLSKGVYDITVTTLNFRNNIKGHIFVNWLNPYKEQKLVVVGSKSMAVFDDCTEQKLFIYPHKVKWTNGRIPVAEKAEYYIVNVSKKEPLREELKHFTNCVKTRENPRTDGREGLKVLRVLEMAERSLEKNCEGKR